MKSGPLVSVIIPTYNRTAKLKRAIQSVLAQSYANLEVIVGDDGSEENIVVVCDGFEDERVKCVSIPHSGLPACARNAALKKATGQYIAFLDSDDTWHADKIQTQVEIIGKHPELTLVWTNAQIADDGVLTGGNYFLSQPNFSPDSVSAMLKANPVITSTAMTTKPALEKTGFFDESPELAGQEDYALWLRLATIGGVHYDHNPMGVYHRSPDSISGVDVIRDRKRRLAVLANFHNWEGAGRYKAEASSRIRRTKFELFMLMIRRGMIIGAFTEKALWSA